MSTISKEIVECINAIIDDVNRLYKEKHLSYAIEDDINKYCDFDIQNFPDVINKLDNHNVLRVTHNDDKTCLSVQTACDVRYTILHLKAIHHLLISLFNS